VNRPLLAATAVAYGVSRLAKITYVAGSPVDGLPGTLKRLRNPSFEGLSTPRSIGMSVQEFLTIN
jgi:hypothetical protein